MSFNPDFDDFFSRPCKAFGVNKLIKFIAFTQEQTVLNTKPFHTCSAYKLLRTAMKVKNRSNARFEACLPLAIDSSENLELKPYISSIGDAAIALK